MRLTGGKDIAFGNYGPAWKLHRKLFVTALRLYLKDTPLVEEKVGEQVQRVLQYIADQKGKPFDPSNILARSVANVICGITFGNRLSSSHPDFDRLLELNQIAFTSTEVNQTAQYWDFFPFAKYLPLKAYTFSVKLADDIFMILRKQLRQADETFDPSQPIGDLISGLIKARNAAAAEETEEKSALLLEDYMINTIEDMFAAGYETTSTTLRWAIAFLTNFPETQTKIQQELDDVVGHDRPPSLDDRPNMPLLQASIMEVQRLGNIADQAVPHYTLTDTTLCGYRVPKDTVVLPNLEAVHLDPECWENPNDFNPYRHIDTDGKLITNQGNWLPFSAGRRVCAGESLAKVELFLFLSIMLQRYTFVPEEGKEPPSLKGCVTGTQAPLPYTVVAVKR